MVTWKMNGLDDSESQPDELALEAETLIFPGLGLFKATYGLVGPFPSVSLSLERNPRAICELKRRERLIGGHFFEKKVKGVARISEESWWISFIFVSSFRSGTSSCLPCV